MAKTKKVEISTMEIAFIDPGFLTLDTEKFQIPVGTMAIVPHVHADVRMEHHHAENTEDEPDIHRLPECTLLVAGQSLKRELYPELSTVYYDTGGFDFFTLPYLVKKFIIGVDSDTDELVWGDAVIYYQTVPEIITHPRDIRQA